MKAVIRSSALLLFLATLGMGQSVTSYISQIADGGAWQTTIVIANTSSSNTFASVNFFQDTTGGNTQSWSLGFQEGSTQNLSLPGGATKFFHTLGTAPVTSVGWAQVIASGPGVAGLVAYAIFTQRIPGHTDQDGTAPAAAGASRFLVPFNNTGGFSTALAITNYGSSGTISVNIQSDTGVISHDSFSLPAQGHLAFALAQQFPSTAGQRGMVELYMPGSGRDAPALAAIALLFNPTGAFTTAPVYGHSGTPIIGVVPPAGAK